MGTPDFAVPCLNALVEAGHEILCVVAQPDKPKEEEKNCRISSDYCARKRAQGQSKAAQEFKKRSFC